MAEDRKAYVVRDAGTPSRLGRIYKVYPYTLRALIDAMEDARFRSFAGDAQVVVRVEGTSRTVFRCFEHGREVPVPPPDA